MDVRVKPNGSRAPTKWKVFSQAPENVSSKSKVLLFCKIWLFLHLFTRAVHPPPPPKQKVVSRSLQASNYVRLFANTVVESQ